MFSNLSCRLIKDETPFARSLVTQMKIYNGLSTVGTRDWNGHRVHLEGSLIT